MTAHTPGPWTIRTAIDVNAPELPEYPEVVHDRADGSSRYVCRMFGYAPDVLSESEANARLISAAPELLAALREFIAYMQDDEPDSEHGERCCELGRAAIAKAEGR